MIEGGWHLRHSILLMEIHNHQSVDVSIDPVNIPGDLSENPRVRWHGAGMNGPGHNPELLAVDKQGSTIVTLQFANFP